MSLFDMAGCLAACASMHSFIVWFFPAIASRCAGVDASDGFDPVFVGASLAGLRVVSRCDGLEALLGSVLFDGGGVWAKARDEQSTARAAALTA